MYSLFMIPKKSVFQLKEREGPWGVGMALAGVAVITAPPRTLLPPSLHDQPPVEQFFPFAGKSRLTDRLEEADTERMLAKLKISITSLHQESKNKKTADVTVQNLKIKLR